VIHNGTPLISRLALAVPEARRDLDLSLSELARLANVSRATVTKIDHGRPVDPALLVQVASTLLVLDVIAPAADPAEALVEGWAA
jgi:predicted transcriptional regulator